MTNLKNTKYQIRKAIKQDDGLKYILLAAKDVLLSFSKKNYLAIGETLFRSKKNKFSYEHAYSIINQNEVIGMVIIYHENTEYSDIINQEKKLEDEFGIQMKVPKEGIENTFYIDTIAVSPEYQGQGIASSVFIYLKEKYKILSLLVDKEKKIAYNMYLKQGFIIYDEIELYEHQYYRMIYRKN